MKIFILTVFLAMCFSASLFAQGQDTTQTMQKKQPPPQQKAKKMPVYYGGSIGLSFGNYFRVNVSPLVGFRYSPKASVGLRVAYEYIEDKRYDPKLTSSNYGGNLFARYRIIPKAYGHVEFAYMSYKYKISNLESDRTWVPFLLLGGGYVQPISPNASFIVEVLVDVLQDDRSPYKAWDPLVSVGIGVGF